MRTISLLAVGAALSFATVVAAQTKISGTSQCGKPDQQQKIDVGDRPDHAFTISQGKCTWTKPWEIAGIQSKEGVGTSFAEISGTTARTRGYFVDTMANGDKAHYRTESADTLKDGVPQSVDGKWTLIRGTGKLKGIKGQGTYKCQAAGEGSTCDVEGEYTLPAPK